MIGTINNPNILTLNLHQNFKWILYVNNAEPVKSYLKRYLERKLIHNEVKKGEIKELSQIIEWVSLFWSLVNKYIEQYNSSDLTLGKPKPQFSIKTKIS